MPDVTLVERVAATLYTVRRPSYVPEWADAPAGHALREVCLRDAQIAVDAIASDVLVDAVDPLSLPEEGTVTDPHAELKQQIRELIAQLDPRPNCPATHPLGPCFGQVDHGAIHWIWVPHEQDGESGHMRLIWTEDVDDAEAEQ